MVDPGWTRYLVATTEPFDRGSTEGRPTESVDARLLREGEWIGDELSTLILGIVKPLVHEIAQRNPRTFALTDGLIGQAIVCSRSRVFIATPGSPFLLLMPISFHCIICFATETAHPGCHRDG